MFPVTGQRGLLASLAGREGAKLTPGMRDRGVDAKHPEVEVEVEVALSEEAAAGHPGVEADQTPGAVAAETTAVEADQTPGAVAAETMASGLARYPRVGCCRHS